MAEADLCQVVGCRRLRVDGREAGNLDAGCWMLDAGTLGWDGVGIGITHYLRTAGGEGRRDHHRQFGCIWVQQPAV